MDIITFAEKIKTVRLQMSLSREKFAKKQGILFVTIIAGSEECAGLIMIRKNNLWKINF